MYRVGRDLVLVVAVLLFVVAVHSLLGCAKAKYNESEDEQVIETTENTTVNTTNITNTTTTIVVPAASTDCLHGGFIHIHRNNRGLLTARIRFCKKHNAHCNHR